MASVRRPGTRRRSTGADCVRGLRELGILGVYPERKDIRVFLVFHNCSGGWSMKSPEGWTQNGFSREGKKSGMGARTVVHLLAGLVVAATAMILAAGAVARPFEDGPSEGGCGLPDTRPLWIDYGEGSVTPDVRAVLARPGVVVSTSGPALAATFRRQGAATTYFVLHLRDLVGGPNEPAGPATNPGAAAGRLAEAEGADARCAPGC